MSNKLQKLGKSLVVSIAFLASAEGFAQTTITDEAGLKAMAKDLTGSYVLAGDITLSGEWKPIGSEKEPFSGTLDGAGHTIKNLTITTKDSSNVAFFSFIKGATITNIRFTGAHVDGYKQVGIVAAQAYASNIDRVFTSGVITGYDHVGGIIGEARGDANNGELTTISNCVSMAGAFSTTYQAGVIAGWSNAGVFTNCVALGSATAPTLGAGGIVGLLEGGVTQINKCVSAAAFITGSKDNAHGLVGGQVNNPSFSGEGNYSSTATVITAGGIVLTEAERTGDFEGTLTSPDNLKKAATYIDLGYNSQIWTLKDGQYPLLAGMMTPVAGDAISVNSLPEKCVKDQIYSSQALSALGRKISIITSNAQVVEVEGADLKFIKPGKAIITYTTAGDDFAQGATLTQDITVSDINYAITTPQDLVNMKYNLAGNYTLENDIDMTGVKWTPIGEGEDKGTEGKFTGTFNGKGHVIRNLSYNNPQQSKAGLFGDIQNATIQDLGMENASIVGNQNVGGIAGRIMGSTIKRCYVANSYLEGYDHVGAICGEINYDVTNDENPGGTVTDCLSDSRIVSRSYQAGGLIGTSKKGTLQNSYFSGTIDCPNGAAGLISLIDDDKQPTIIQNCLVAASHIYAKDISRVTNTADREVTLLNNYSLIHTYCGTNASDAGIMENMNDATSANGANVNDDTDALSKDFYQTILGWDFDETWKFFEGVNGNMYPVLQWMQAPLPSVVYDMPHNKSLLWVDGTESLDMAVVHGSWGQKLNFEVSKGKGLATYVKEEGKLYVGNENAEYGGSGDVQIKVEPVEEIASLFTMEGENTFTVYVGKADEINTISSVEDLLNISRNLSGKYQLTKDIDMAGIEFSGIGSKAAQFRGEFDGNGHKIMNATVSVGEENTKGFFNAAEGATIKKLALTNLSVMGVTSGDYSKDLGGMFGSCKNTTIDQCVVTGKVRGNDHVGGLVGGDCANVTLTNTYVNIDVSGGSQVGGLFGVTTGNIKISNSYFDGSATISYRGWCGGFIGLIDTEATTIDIQHCASMGNVISGGTDGPHAAQAFIAGNGHEDNKPKGIIVFKDNISNSDAQILMSGDDAGEKWPSINITAEGGDVENMQKAPTSALQQSETFTNMGWDFESVWSIDEGKTYPYLKLFGYQTSGIESVLSGYDGNNVCVSAFKNAIIISGLKGCGRIVISDMSGAIVASQAINRNTKVDFPYNGLYIVTIIQKNETKSYKIVVK